MNITLASFKKIQEDYNELQTATKNACSILKLAIEKTPGYGNVSLDVQDGKIRVTGYGILSQSKSFEDSYSGHRVTIEYEQVRRILFFGTEDQFFSWLCS